MSVKALSWVWHSTPQEVKGNRLVALLALADIADDDGVCRFADDTSQKALAVKSRMAVSTFREVTEWLVEHGYIEAVRESRSESKGYKLLLEDRRNPAPESGARTAGNRRSGPPESGAHSSIDVFNVISAFEEFWNLYPRHVGKAAAKGAFSKLAKRGEDLHAVLAGARRFAADPNLPEARFIPHPTTWLNQGRWEDEALPPRGEQSAPAAGSRSAEAEQEAERDAWLAARQITLDEWLAHQDDPAWRSELEQRYRERLRRGEVAARD